MDIKVAGLIAGAIAIVGGGWLYWTEIRPAQLREECASAYIAEGEQIVRVKELIALCVSAGGIDIVSTALDKNSAKEPAAEEPAAAFPAEGDVAGQ